MSHTVMYTPWGTIELTYYTSAQVQANPSTVPPSTYHHVKWIATSKDNVVLACGTAAHDQRAADAASHAGWAHHYQIPSHILRGVGTTPLLRFMVAHHTPQVADVRFVHRDYVHLHPRLIELDAAKKRIAELEAEVERLKARHRLKETARRNHTTPLILNADGSAWEEEPTLPDPAEVDAALKNLSPEKQAQARQNPQLLAQYVENWRRSNLRILDRLTVTEPPTPSPLPTVLVLAASGE